MNKITEGDLTFSFPPGCQASKYDDWSFYRNQFQSVAGGSKGVDILCVESDTSWLIEIKDYRKHYRTNPSNIADEVVNKVRDTLAGLAAAAKVAHEADQRELARKALKTSQWRVVLHLEQSATPSRLGPDPTDLRNKLRTRKLKAVDAHPIVCDRKTTPNYVPWGVE